MFLKVAILLLTENALGWENASINWVLSLVHALRLNKNIQLGTAIPIIFCYPPHSNNQLWQIFQYYWGILHDTTLKEEPGSTVVDIIVLSPADTFTNIINNSNATGVFCMSLSRYFEAK